MKITFLGTNSWFSTKTGNTVCALIEAEDFYIILDAGDGIHKLGKYFKGDKPIYMFLSHFHFDHIIGFHAMNKADAIMMCMLRLQQAFMPFFSFLGWKSRIILQSTPLYPTRWGNRQYYPLPLGVFLGTLGPLSFAEMKFIALNRMV